MTPAISTVVASILLKIPKSPFAGTAASSWIQAVRKKLLVINSKANVLRMGFFKVVMFTFSHQIHLHSRGHGLVFSCPRHYLTTAWPDQSTGQVPHFTATHKQVPRGRQETATYPRTVPPQCCRHLRFSINLQ